MATITEDLALDGEALKVTYEALRAELRDDYRPREWEQLEKTAAALGAVGDSQAGGATMGQAKRLGLPGAGRIESAARMSEEAAELRDSYEDRVFRKWCLAILRGSYDDGIAGGFVGSHYDPEKNDTLLRFAAERKRRIEIQA